MTQEAVENRSGAEAPSDTRLLWERLETAIKNSPNIVAPQKEALINSLSPLLDEVCALEKKVSAYQEFTTQIEGILEDGIVCESVDIAAEQLIREVFRRVLDINYDNLTPLERRDIEDVLNEFPFEHEITDLPI